MFGLAPASASGYVFGSRAATYRLNRPTVTSYLSSQNGLTVTRCSGSSMPSPPGYRSFPSGAILRPIGKLPPGTNELVQQLPPRHSVPTMPAHDGPIGGGSPGATTTSG